MFIVKIKPDWSPPSSTFIEKYRDQLPFNETTVTQPLYEQWMAVGIQRVYMKVLE